MTASTRGLAGPAPRAARIARGIVQGICFLLFPLLVGPSLADSRSAGVVAPGEDIVIGQTMPYSGPASMLGTYGRVEAAFFRMLNEQGGIVGRKIRLVSLDDGYSPPKTFEMTRRLVEDESVFLIFGSLGAATNAVIMDYLNKRQIPHLFLATAARKFYDPARNPWTMGILFSFEEEAATCARHLIARHPQAKIAILSQNDDLGRSYTTGFREGLGDAVSAIVSEQTYETTDPTVDQQLVAMKTSGADSVFIGATPRAAARAIARMADMDWRPKHVFLSFTGSSVGTTIAAAGVEKAQQLELFSLSPIKDAGDARLRDLPDVAAYRAFMAKYVPDARPEDQHNVLAYISAHLMAHVLRAAGPDLTRRRVLDIATTLTDVDIPMLLPGVRINTRPDSYQQIRQLQMRRFRGTGWESIGPLIDTKAAGSEAARPRR